MERLMPMVLAGWLIAAHACPLRAEEPYVALCAGCHGRRGEGSDRSKVPAIAGLPDYYVVQQLDKFKRGLRTGERGSRISGNMHAAAVTIDERTARSIAQAIAGMRPAITAPTLAGDAQEGRSLYARYCADRHGQAAEGSAAKESPPLHGFQDWYLEAQIRGFRAGERKADPMNIDSIRMHQMARELRRNRDVRNVARFIGDSLRARPDAEP